MTELSASAIIGGTIVGVLTAALHGTVRAWRRERKAHDLTRTAYVAACKDSASWREQFARADAALKAIYEKRSKAGEQAARTRKANAARPAASDMNPTGNTGDGVTLDVRDAVTAYVRSNDALPQGVSVTGYIDPDAYTLTDRDAPETGEGAAA